MFVFSQNAPSWMFNKVLSTHTFRTETTLFTNNSWKLDCFVCLDRVGLACLLRVWILILIFVAFNHLWIKGTKQIETKIWLLWEFRRRLLIKYLPTPQSKETLNTWSWSIGYIKIQELTLTEIISCSDQKLFCPHEMVRYMLWIKKKNWRIRWSTYRINSSTMQHFTVGLIKERVL